MQEETTDKMTPFDRLISSKDLQLMKLIIPYTPPANQHMLAILVKFLELNRTIKIFHQSRQNIHTQTFEKSFSSPLDIVDEIRPYLSEAERTSIDSILNVFNMMQMLEAMEKMSSQNNQSETETFNPMDMVKEMLTPEQQTIFEMYNTMFQENDDNDNKKGDL